eukprot:gnl/MRDRNA2_/MRDRNA2_120984_c0_seq1.p1 gnl/MRDRNA2_/MRDRNA2_120984_c0~~gnl/MRDRNA2_/MRDRNA2_120984_c0_seq1.p1  ORF type:complete len:231 (-),score=21.99 gnl/MRDRNA2_/MRDRNA2_120984_c0_seq1:282-974(-)
MQPSIFDWSRVVLAAEAPAFTLRTLQGVCEGLGVFVLVASAAMMCGFTDKFITLSFMGSKFVKKEHDPSSPLLSCNPAKYRREEGYMLPSALKLARCLVVFVRCLFVPTLFEECLWRAALTPLPGELVSDPLSLGLSEWLHELWCRVLLANAAFAAYHVLFAPLLAAVGRTGAIKVFSDPCFLTFSFILGNCCTWSYLRSGGSLLAPVLVHAIPVALWLEIGGGERHLTQ